MLRARTQKSAPEPDTIINRVDRSMAALASGELPGRGARLLSRREQNTAEQKRRACRRSIFVR
jgi:predicted RNA-binding protein YlxR (DUF448 family)